MANAFSQLMGSEQLRYAPLFLLKEASGLAPDSTCCEDVLAGSVARSGVYGALAYGRESRSGGSERLRGLRMELLAEFPVGNLCADQQLNERLGNGFQPADQILSAGVAAIMVSKAMKPLKNVAQVVTTLKIDVHKTPSLPGW
jgi:hypothetical protein